MNIYMAVLQTIYSSFKIPYFESITNTIKLFLIVPEGVGTYYTGARFWGTN